jgi:hypothetical protein
VEIRQNRSIATGMGVDPDNRAAPEGYRSSPNDRLPAVHRRNLPIPRDVARPFPRPEAKLHSFDHTIPDRARDQVTRWVTYGRESRYGYTGEWAIGPPKGIFIDVRV